MSELQLIPSTINTGDAAQGNSASVGSRPVLVRYGTSRHRPRSTRGQDHYRTDHHFTPDGMIVDREPALHRRIPRSPAEPSFLGRHCS